jgi:hypothetical protein
MSSLDSRDVTAPDSREVHPREGCAAGGGDFVRVMGLDGEEVGFGGGLLGVEEVGEDGWGVSDMMVV